MIPGMTTISQSSATVDDSGTGGIEVLSRDAARNGMRLQKHRAQHL